MPISPTPSATLTPQSARVLPFLVAMAFFMQMLDATILNTALPSMATDLNVSPFTMRSAIIAYMLTTALLIPASGWIADRFGIKSVFVVAILLFTLGSLCCALSTTLTILVASRVIQGIGGALLVPVGRLAILKAYPRHELMRVLSFVTLPGLLGPLLGPTTGGFLVEYASWHWIFLINIPIGIIGVILALKYMPQLRSAEKTSFDFLGFAFFSLAMVLILLGMEEASAHKIPWQMAFMLCGIGGTLLVIYWVRACRIPHPLFSPALFRIRSFAVGICGNLFSRFASGSMPFLMPLFLQLGLGFSPSTAGLFMMPMALAAIAGKQAILPLVNRFGFKLFLVINTVLLGGLLSCFSFIDATTPTSVLLSLLAAFGIVNSMQFTAMNSLTLIDLTENTAASGNSLLSMIMQISVVIGVAIAATLLDMFSAPYGGSPSALQLMHVFHQTFMWVGSISIITAVIFSFTPKETAPQ